MARTPEGRVKDLVKAVLEEYGIYPAGHAVWFDDDRAAIPGWYYMPVQTGMGVAGIPDFIGCYKGRFWAIETKAGTELTPNQAQRRIEINDAGGSVFIVRTESDLELFVQEIVMKLSRR